LGGNVQRYPYSNNNKTQILSTAVNQNQFSSITQQNEHCIAVSSCADLVLYIAMNFAGLYAKYLTDRAGRKAFAETWRSYEIRLKAERENEKQEKLLLSGLGGC
jgi:hypothetical protein